MTSGGAIIAAICGEAPSRSLIDDAESLILTRVENVKTIKAFIIRKWIFLYSVFLVYLVLKKPINNAAKL